MYGVNVRGDTTAPTSGNLPEADRLLLALVRVAQAERRQRGRAHTAPASPAVAPLAPRHLAALTQVVLHGPLSVSTLTERLGIALTTASLLVTQLADAGLVERREDAADHRRTLASVRQSRSDEVLQLVNAHLQPLQRTLDRLGRQRGEALLEGLDVLVQELDRRPAPLGDASAADQPSGASAGIGANTVPTDG